MRLPPSEADAAPRLEITGYRAGDLLIDIGRARTTRDGAEIPLPRLTFDLLVALAAAAPNIATIDDLMRLVWPKVVVNPETVAQRIKLLRAALGDDPQEPRYIAGVRGRGYRLVCAVEAVPASVAPVPAASPRPPAPAASARKRATTVALIVAASVAVAAGWLIWRRAPYRPTPVVAASQLPPRSIAVLPFKDLNGDPEDDVLALGIPEALLHQLASFEDLDVIARTSSFSFQGHDQDIRAIGQQLGARYILEGSVQRDKQRLRVTAQLVDAQSGAHVWSMQFDRTPQNVFDMQDAIALDVARALNISLQPGEAAPRQGSTPFEAYLEYLQGSRLLDTWRRADMKAAAIHATRAIALDPNYAEGLVLLARANVRFADYDSSPGHERRFREGLPAASALLDRALALNPNLASAYSARGYVNAFSDLAAAETDYRKALKLKPSDVQALEELAAVIYEDPARRGEALELIDRARKLDPLEPGLDVVKATYLFYGLGDLGGAEKLLQDALRRNPLFEPAQERLAEVYWNEGRYAEGIKIAEQLVAADSTAGQRHLMLESLYLDIQDLKAAEQIAHSMSTPSPSLAVPLLMARGRWLDAGRLALHAMSSGTITPMEEPIMVAALRMYARTARQYRQAIDLLARRSQTEQDEAGQPIVLDPSTKYLNVVGFADLLIQSGQTGLGRRLLESTLAAMDRDMTVPGKGTLWQQEMRGVALALLGRDDEAIAVLRTAVSTNSVGSWWYDLQSEPAYAKLRNDPRFQAILKGARERADSERQAVEKLRASHLVPDRG